MNDDTTSDCQTWETGDEVEHVTQRYGREVVTERASVQLIDGDGSPGDLVAIETDGHLVLSIGTDGRLRHRGRPTNWRRAE